MIKILHENYSEFDYEMTRRALELASLGAGSVSPGPLVGCVIVDEDHDIVGEGTYIYNNVTHAEVIALEKAGTRARGGTAYVSLEPHAHRGRTEPCTTALIDAGIQRVVAPMEDPNPLVCGAGFEELREAGIQVSKGILKESAMRLNESFILWHTESRPFVHLKLAMSIDGRISQGVGVATSISGEIAANRVQDIRHGKDAILIGGNTALIDDPELSDRSGKRRRRKLVRIILDNRLQIRLDSKLVKTAGEFPTLVFSDSRQKEKIESLEKLGVEVENVDAHNLSMVLDVLYKRDIQSLLVEGGTEVAGSFVDARLVDKVTFMMAPILIGGSDAPVAIGGKGIQNIDEALNLTSISVQPLGADLEITGYPEGKSNGA